MKESLFLGYQLKDLLIGIRYWQDCLRVGKDIDSGYVLLGMKEY